MTVEPMVRRRIDEWSFADIDASAGSAEHSDANARFGVARCPFAFENSRAALHPIRLPQAVAGPALLVVDPPIKRHEIKARAVVRRIARIQTTETMDHPIERSLLALRVRRAKKIDEIAVGHEQRALLDGPLES